jgi:hypothetical protein
MNRPGQLQLGGERHILASDDYPSLTGLHSSSTVGWPEPLWWTE